MIFCLSQVNTDSLIDSSSNILHSGAGIHPRTGGRPTQRAATGPQDGDGGRADRERDQSGARWAAHGGRELAERMHARAALQGGHSAALPAGAVHALNLQSDHVCVSRTLLQQRVVLWKVAWPCHCHEWSTDHFELRHLVVAREPKTEVPCRHNYSAPLSSLVTMLCGRQMAGSIEECHGAADVELRWRLREILRAGNAQGIWRESARSAAGGGSAAGRHGGGCRVGRRRAAAGAERQRRRHRGPRLRPDRSRHPGRTDCCHSPQGMPAKTSRGEVVLAHSRSLQRWDITAAGRRVSSQGVAV